MISGGSSLDKYTGEQKILHIVERFLETLEPHM